MKEKQNAEAMRGTPVRKKSTKCEIDMPLKSQIGSPSHYNSPVISDGVMNRIKTEKTRKKRSRKQSSSSESSDYALPLANQTQPLAKRLKREVLSDECNEDISSNNLVNTSLLDNSMMDNSLNSSEAFNDSIDTPPTASDLLPEFLSCSVSKNCTNTNLKTRKTKSSRYRNEQILAETELQQQSILMKRLTNGSEDACNNNVEKAPNSSITKPSRVTSKKASYSYDNNGDSDDDGDDDNGCDKVDKTAPRSSIGGSKTGSRLALGSDLVAESSLSERSTLKMFCDMSQSEAGHTITTPVKDFEAMPAPCNGMPDWLKDVANGKELFLVSLPRNFKKETLDNARIIVDGTTVIKSGSRADNNIMEHYEIRTARSLTKDETKSVLYRSNEGMSAGPLSGSITVRRILHLPAISPPQVDNRIPIRRDWTAPISKRHNPSEMGGPCSLIKLRRSIIGSDTPVVERNQMSKRQKKKKEHKQHSSDVDEYKSLKKKKKKRKHKEKLDD